MSLQILLLLFPAILAHSCAQYKPVPQRIEAPTRLCYVVARDNDDGIFAGDFGDVVILGVETSQTVRVTDDRYIDESPRWSPTGEVVTFLSSRGAGESMTRLRELGTPLGLYCYSPAGGLIRRLAQRFANGGPMDSIHCYDWFPVDGSLLVSRGDSIVYRVSYPEDSIAVYLSIDGGRSISEISCSPNGRWIALKCYRSERGAKGWYLKDSLLVVNVADKNIQGIPRTCSTPLRLVQGWSPDGDRLLTRELIVNEYACESGRCSTYSHPVLKMESFMGTFCYANDGRVFFTGRHGDHRIKTISAFEPVHETLDTLLKSDDAISFEYGGLWREPVRR